MGITVAGRWAFIVAIEKHLDPTFGTFPYAETGAKSLSDALAGVGYPKANQFVLLGSQATKTAIESRLRKLRKTVRKGDDVLVYWAGRGFTLSGSSYLASWDVLADDLADTCVSLADLVDTITGSKAGQVAFFFDAANLDADQLERLFADSPKAVALTAASAGETSAVSASWKASIWSHLIAEAMTGRAAKAMDRASCVTALSLHRCITDEMPRTLRQHCESGVEQHPQMFGEQNGGFILADLSRLVGGADGVLDPARLRRVVFRSDSVGRVKDLVGFRKTFTVPENAGPYNRKFVARIAAPDVKADLDAVFEATREHLGYKRKDVEVSAGSDGFGFLRGPDFEYTVSAALDADDPSQLTWRREVGQFADAGFVRRTGFHAVFGKLFDQLAFEFLSAVDVPALVDRLEDHPPAGVKVHVNSDGTACEITLKGLAGRVTVEQSSLTVHGRAGDSAGLLEQFLRFLNTVGPLGEPLALPSVK